VSVPLVQRQPVVPQRAGGGRKRNERLVQQFGQPEFGALRERTLAPERDVSRLGAERL
jgi:hypothetical protein